MTLRIDASELGRYRLEGKLGEGADLEVFAATDSQTDIPVVIKRPHPTIVSRSQHSEVERRIATATLFREQFLDSLPNITRLLAYTEPYPHDDFFGDSLGDAYSVTIEERAKGLPLVGSALDGIKRKPIGLPQNLFALHPVIGHKNRVRFSILLDILDVAEAFHNAGVLLLDLRPQNVYFNPQDATIKVIDVSNIAEERQRTHRHAALDLHDFYLELFKWYLTPVTPPSEPSIYCEPYGMDSVAMFNQNMSALIRDYSDQSSDSRNLAVLTILEKVKERAYENLPQFRADFEEYLTSLEETYERHHLNSILTEAWEKSESLLHDPYWNKYLFDPDQDLTHFSP